MRVVSLIFRTISRLFTPKLGIIAGPAPVARSDIADSVYIDHHGDWSKLARSESPSAPFANQGKCVCYESRGGHVVDLVKPDIFLYTR